MKVTDFVNRYGKKLTVSRKKKNKKNKKLLPVNRKSHHPIETLALHLIDNRSSSSLAVSIPVGNIHLVYTLYPGAVHNITTHKLKRS